MNWNKLFEVFTTLIVLGYAVIGDFEKATFYSVVYLIWYVNFSNKPTK